MNILLFKKLGFIAFIPLCLTIFFEYPSFSKNYTLNKKKLPNENQTFKLKKTQPDQHISQHSNRLKNGIEVFKDGCIIKKLRLRNGMNLKIKQNCN